MPAIYRNSASDNRTYPAKAVLQIEIKQRYQRSGAARGYQWDADGVCRIRLDHE